MSERDTVRCRAQIHPHCEDGTLLKHWTEDGTFDGETICCNACRSALYRCNRHDLDLERDRIIQRYVHGATISQLSELYAASNTAIAVRLREAGVLQGRRAPSFEDRFWSKVVKSADCWVWQGAKTPSGYGKIRHPDGRYVYTHRQSYEWAKGEIPEGLVIDHICRNTSCVNPDHLDSVTQGENVRRSLERRAAA